MQLIRACHTRFPYGSTTEWLNLAAYNNSPDRSTKSTISHLNVLYVLVNIRFQVLFHSPPGVLLTFPSQYCSTIGHRVVFRLRGWSPHIQYGLHVSVLTPDTNWLCKISSTGLSPPTVDLPMSFDYPAFLVCLSLPRNILLYLGLASFAFARRYLRNLVWFLFLRLLRCFTSAGSPHYTIWFI